MTQTEPDPKETSLSLLGRAADNDQQAWRDLVQSYGPLVYHWCRQSGLRGSDAADVLQEVFHSLAANLKNFRKASESDRFRAWLWTITRNKLRDLARMESKKAKATGGSSAYQRLLELPEQETEELSRSVVLGTKSLVFEKLAKVREQVQEKTFRAFYRVTIDEMPVETVAEELGISQSSVYQAKSRVLKRLRNELS